MSDQPDESDTRSTPTRPWWRKKRWVVVGVLWLGFGYLLSSGPARYAEGRGWLSNSIVFDYTRPASRFVWRVPYLADAYFPYVNWWYERGRARFVHRSEPGVSGWKIVVSWNEPNHEEHAWQTGEQGAGAVCMFWTGPDGAAHCRYTRHFTDGHAVVIDNGCKQPDGSWEWDGPVLFDGETVAELPVGTQKISIEYIDGELAVEADGIDVEINQ